MHGRALQSIFVLAGIALVITGLNTSRPLVIVGVSLIALVAVGQLLKHRRQ